MNIHESCLALIRVDSRFQSTLNRTCVQRIENAHNTRIRKTNTRAPVYNPGSSQKLFKLEINSYRCSQLECNEENGETESYSALYTPLLPLSSEIQNDVRSVA